MAAHLKRDHGSSDNITADEVRRALDRVLASKHFLHAPMKRKFLQLICDFYINGRAGELNEYLIGREVFERDDSYNPSADPIVRVGAHDVRKKLEVYYEKEGVGDEVRLEIPVGSYEPVFVRRPPDADPAAEEPPGTSPISGSPSRTSDKSLWLMRATLAALAIAVAWLAISNVNLRREVSGTNLLKTGASYGAVWEPFLNSTEQTLVVVSNPPVYRFSNSVDPDVLIKHSIGLNEEQAADLAEQLKDKFVVKQNRELRLVLSPEDYTGMGEAIGLYRITDLFRSTGKATLLKQSRTASAEDLKNHNVILLGSVWANEWSGRLPVQEDFTYTPNATIQNLAPLQGESAEYHPEFDAKTGDLLVDYALVTVKPNISFDDTVMVLAGIHSEGTEAAAEYVTNKTYLNDLNQRLRQAGGEQPFKYYQVLLKVGVENSIPTTVSVVTVHELRVTRE